MIILAAWVLLSFVVAAIWAAEGFGGPLDDAMTATRRVVPLTWDVRWGWFILIPALLLTCLFVDVSQRIQRDGGLEWLEVFTDLWAVIVLGRKPLLRD